MPTSDLHETITLSILGRLWLPPTPVATSRILRVVRYHGSSIPHDPSTLPVSIDCAETLEEAIEDYLTINTGDFSALTDYEAVYFSTRVTAHTIHVLTLGNPSNRTVTETTERAIRILHPWQSEDNEFTFSDCMNGAYEEVE